MLVYYYYRSDKDNIMLTKYILQYCNKSPERERIKNASFQQQKSNFIINSSLSCLIGLFDPITNHCFACYYLNGCIIIELFKLKNVFS
jgi:hypothetical protein